MRLRISEVLKSLNHSEIGVARPIVVSKMMTWIHYQGATIQPQAQPNNQIPWEAPAFSSKTVEWHSTE